MQNVKQIILQIGVTASNLHNFEKRQTDESVAKLLAIESTKKCHVC